MQDKQRVGDMLINAGLLKDKQLRQALQVQVGSNRRLGVILVKMNLITADQLQSVLSEQLGLPIITVAKQFLPEVKRILPKYLCRRYSVIPLSLGENNLLNLAMVDPSDSIAIWDIEHYTGRVVRPFLSAKKDIDKSINRLIPWTLKDIFNPQNNSKMTAIIATIALTMIVITGIQFYNDKTVAKFGIISRKNNEITYANHELFVTFHKNQQITLRGHGAYTTGYYSITFPDRNAFENFINTQEKYISIQQHTWIQLILSRR